MQLLQDDASLPNDIEALETQIQEIKERRNTCQNTIQSLMAKEDPLKGVFFAQEIHEAKKNYMLLQYQYDLRIAKKNRLLRGFE